MIVTLLSDYGVGDVWAGVCHAVVLERCPDANVVHLTHGISPFDVRHGALALAAALPYVPVGVHLAVVDPGVGTARRALAMETEDGRRLVGPDNGLLSLAWPACGGVAAVVDIGESRHRLEPRLGHLPRPRPVRPRRRGAGRRGGPRRGGRGARPGVPRGAQASASPRGGRHGGGDLPVGGRLRQPRAGRGGGGVRAAGWAPGDHLAVEAAGTLWKATCGRTFGDVEPGELLSTSTPTERSP